MSPNACFFFLLFVGFFWYSCDCIIIIVSAKLLLKICKVNYIYHPCGIYILKTWKFHGGYLWDLHPFFNYLHLQSFLLLFGNSSNKGNKIKNRIERKLILMAWIMYQQPISIRGRNEGSIKTIIYFYFKAPCLSFFF